jgi:phospholipid N-methyltransferase
MKYLIIFLFLKLSVVGAVELNITQAIFDAESQNLVIPDEQSYRIATLNQYGYMFTKFDPIVEKFLQAIQRKPDQIVFEVGGAYGNVAEVALEKGIKKYYLNDAEAAHLKSFARKLKIDKKEHLFTSLCLIAGRCPDEVDINDEVYDSILVNKVLHFFTPETIDAFIKWLKKGLKVGGRIYLLTISPFYKGHTEWLSHYQERKQQGLRFPGYYPDYATSTFAQGYPSASRPASLLFMELDTLKSIFIEHGFQMEEEFELAVIDNDHADWRPGKDMVGIIVIKQASSFP